MRSTTSTKERMIAIAKGFNEFDLDLRRGTRKRREKDEIIVSRLEVEVVRIQTELNGEIKRREEVNKSIQMWFDKEVALVNSDAQIQLEVQRQIASDRIDEVRERIVALQKEFDRDRAEVSHAIETQGARLFVTLQDFQDTFEQDRCERIRTENALEDQLASHCEHVNSEFKAQIELRESRASYLRELVANTTSEQEKTNEIFQYNFDACMNALQMDIECEQRVRVREDDAIVNALHTFTRKLQASLIVLNSCDETAMI